MILWGFKGCFMCSDNATTWFKPDATCSLRGTFYDRCWVQIRTNHNNNSYYYYYCKTSIAPISSKGIQLCGAPSTGVGQTHSPGTMQSLSTMVRWQGNLGRISKSEKVSFQMVTERNYTIWWRNMFREWIPKSRDNNWKGTSLSMNFSTGNRQQVKTNSGLWC